MFNYYGSIVELEIRGGETSGNSYVVQNLFNNPVFVCLLVCFSSESIFSLKFCKEF